MALAPTAVDWLWLVIALPLAGYALLQVFGKRIGEPRAGWLATGLVGAAFVVAAVASIDVLTGEAPHHTVRLFTWIPALGLDATLLWDPLSTMMTLVVTGVGFLIHLYSVGYMHGDPRFGRFFTYLNLFIASMLILVLGDNFGVLFVGWELVGLSSYLLISFWFEKPVAAAAGKKAFVVNRIGDLGFLVALMLIFAAFGTFDFGAGLRGGAGGAHHRRRHRHHAAAPGRGGGQVRPDPAVRLAPRRHGGPHPGVGPHPRRHHGHRRGVHGGPHRGAVRAGPGVGGGGRRRRAPPPPSSPPPSPSPSATSSACWPTRPSASWVTCSWRWGRPATSPGCSTCSPTPSSRRCCSSAPAR